MKKLLALFLVFLLVGCGSSNDSKLTTSEGRKYDKYDLMIPVMQSIEEYDRQANANVNSRNFEFTKSSYKGDSVDVFKTRAEYDWKDRIYRVDMTFKLVGENAYRVFEYKNHTTGTSYP